MQARVIGQGDLNLRLEITAAAMSCQQCLDAMTDFCRVAIAGYESHTGPEPTERVVAQHHACSRTIVEVDDATDEVDEFGRSRLEQLVPRPGLEYGKHGLAIVTAGVEAETRDDFRNFAAYDRDVVW